MSPPLEPLADAPSQLEPPSELEPGISLSAPRRPIALVPRLAEQGYAPALVAERRRWVEAQAGCALNHVGASSLPTESLRGNIENPIGAAQVPLAVAGPLVVDGEHARGTFYVPLATTEGALVRSYERGMVALTRSTRSGSSGGVQTRIWRDENRVSPLFVLDDITQAHSFARQVETEIDTLRSVVAGTTSHGRLLAVCCRPLGRQVVLELTFHTGDAQGMNMIARASDAVCRHLARHHDAPDWTLFSGAGGEKHASGALLAGGKGKTVTAGAQLPREVVASVLRTTPEALVELGRRTTLGHLHSATLGYNGHLANGLAALFIACGQDVANIVNAAVGITQFSLLASGDLEASVTLPALTVATVGGGTGLATARECLALLDCVGTGKAPRLAEILAATLLAGELSMGAALVSGDFVDAHERYGRNRPAATPDLA